MDIKCKYKLSKSKTLCEMTAEWDAISHYRSVQLETPDLDLSYFKVILPSIERYLRAIKTGPILDAGCGVGAAVSKLISIGSALYGIDPSADSISEARSRFGNLATFECSTIEEFSRLSGRKYAAVIANMVLMNTTDLYSFSSAAASLLRPSGIFVATLTHPCFWSIYKGYSKEPWFEYNKELYIECPFTISLATESSYWTTHIHRPLHAYFEAFSRSGLQCRVLEEPQPTQDQMALYPTKWNVPRYLTLVCGKVGS